MGQHPADPAERDRHLGARLRRDSDRQATAKELDDDKVEGYDIHPRPLVEAVVTDLLKDPSAFMEAAFGKPMSP